MCDKYKLVIHIDKLYDEYFKLYDRKQESIKLLKINQELEIETCMIIDYIKYLDEKIHKVSKDLDYKHFQLEKLERKIGISKSKENKKNLIDKIKFVCKNFI